MVQEENMRNRVKEIKDILERQRWNCNDNEIKKLEDELEIIEKYLL